MTLENKIKDYTETRSRWSWDCEGCLSSLMNEVIRPHFTGKKPHYPTLEEIAEKKAKEDFAEQSK